MDGALSFSIYQFENFLLDRGAGALFRLAPDGGRVELRLGSRAFDLVRLLIERRGEVVSRQQIMDEVWPNLAVEENNLTVQLTAIRRVLDEGRPGPSCIQTVPRRGYRFVLPVSEHADALRPSLAPAPASLPMVDPVPVARRITPWSWFGLALVLLVGLAAGIGWLREATRSHGLVGSPRLSLAVLPFEVLSEQTGQEYLADAITDDLTADLARIQGAFVIARGSAYRFRGQAIAPRQLGEELGVRYLVQGSVKTLGATLRVNVQIVSTDTGAILWSHRVDEPHDNLASGRIELVGRIGAALGIRLVDIEASRSLRDRPTRPDAFDLVLQARAIRNGGRGPEHDMRALQLHEEALRLDPASISAMLGIARILVDRQFATVGKWATTDDLSRAARLIEQAKSMQPIAEEVLVAAAELAQAQERWTELDFLAWQIVERYPNRVEGYELLAMAKRYVGSPAESVRLYEQAIRLNPLESNLYHRCSCMGYALLLVGRYDEAIPWFERSLAANPGASPASRGARYRSIAVAHALSGRIELARSAMRKAQELSPYATARIWFPDNPNDPAQVAQMLRLVEGLRLAGLPDHAEEDVDFGVRSDGKLQTDLSGPTPISIPSVRTITTAELTGLLSEQSPIVLDTMLYSWGLSVPGAVGLKNIGLGGSFEDDAQKTLSRVLQRLTRDNRDRPVVAVGFNALRFDGYNLAIRLTALGYTNVYWYRGGREAWDVEGHPETPVIAGNW